MTYKNWLAEWLENYIQTSNKARTYERYKNMVAIHIAPHLGEYEVDDISAIVLQKFISTLLCKDNKRTQIGLSPSYIACIMAVVKSSLKTAHTLGIVSKYNANNVKLPKIVEKQVDCFSVQEQKKIENYILNNNKAQLKGIIICLYTGLRIGELLALTWDNIDFEKRTLIVSKSCHDGYVNGKHCVIMDTPKTQNSARQIPLSKSIIPLLKELKKNSKCEYVISYNGKQILVRTYQRTFELLLKKLNIPHKGFHSLRHTFATRAIECGMDVKTLSEILGHKNATITLNRYAHSLWEHKVDMMNKIGKLL